MCIASKLFDVMKSITNEQDLPKLRESLITQNLIARTEYEIAASSERVDAKGVVWQVVTVSCRLVIIDVESSEEITNVALGSGIDTGVMAVVKAQEIALRRAWMGALWITSVVEAVSVQDVTPEPQIVVETPEEKLRAEIKALWRWEQSQFPDWITKRVGGEFESADIVRLTAVRDELKGYRKEHG